MITRTALFLILTYLSLAQETNNLSEEEINFLISYQNRYREQGVAKMKEEVSQLETEIALLETNLQQVSLDGGNSERTLQSCEDTIQQIASSSFILGSQGKIELDNKQGILLQIIKKKIELKNKRELAKMTELDVIGYREVLKDNILYPNRKLKS